MSPAGGCHPQRIAEQFDYFFFFGAAFFAGFFAAGFLVAMESLTSSPSRITTDRYLHEPR